MSNYQFNYREKVIYVSKLFAEKVEDFLELVTTIVIERTNRIIKFDIL